MRLIDLYIFVLKFFNAHQCIFHSSTRYSGFLWLWMDYGWKYGRWIIFYVSLEIVSLGGVDFSGEACTFKPHQDLKLKHSSSFSLRQIWRQDDCFSVSSSGFTFRCLFEKLQALVILKYVLLLDMLKSADINSVKCRVLPSKTLPVPVIRVFGLTFIYLWAV